MSVVGRAAALAGGAKRLAGAGAGPNWSVIRPASELKGERPTADPGKEVALVVPFKIFGLDVSDRAAVDVAGREQARLHQIAKPIGAEPVPLAVIDGFDGHAGVLVPRKL